MKSTKYLAAITLLWMSSCNVLEENPESFIAPQNFYKTRSDAIAAVTAAYTASRTNGDTDRNYYILGEITTDNLFPLSNNNDRVQLDLYTHTPQNSVIRETWQNFYTGISRCNIVIERVPLITMDEALRNRLVAEAKFLRGFYYFHLVRLFGNIPLITSEVKSLTDLTYPERVAPAKIYEQIIQDFKDAESVLPVSYTGSDLGRATKGAARSFLASVYLTQKEYQLAADKAKEVMGMGYGLWATHKEVFDVKNEFGKEFIFDAQFMSGPAGQGSNLIAFWAQENNAVAGRGFGSFKITEDIYNSYAANDLRKAAYFIKGTDNLQYCNKWIDADAVTANQADNNVPLIRYAEVVLIFAEAANEASGPSPEVYAAINSIRKRAGLSDLDGLSKDQLRDEIQKERRLELAFEGQRWFDLVRWGQLVPTLKAKGNSNIQDYHVLLPVPQFEIDLNESLKPQNSGYPQ
jgi:starch-binding outer membrane protein, SusD/RagB family